MNARLFLRWGSRAALAALASMSSNPASGDTAKPRPIPFPGGTHVASVEWAVPPKVTEEADRTIVELPAEGHDSITCVISLSRDLEARSAVALAAHRGGSADLSHASVTDLAVAPHVPVVFMTVRQPNAAKTNIAAFRSAESSFACLQDGAGDPSVLKRVVTGLGTSIRPVRPIRGAPDVALVRLCRLALPDGSVGFERWEVSKRGKERISTVTSSLAFRSRQGSGVDLMEIDVSETSDANGRIGGSTLVRMVGGKLETRSVVRHRAGATYEYEVLDAKGPSSGEFQGKDPAGLPSTVAIAKRLKGDVIGGRARTLEVEIWDPFSPTRVPSQMIYSLESRNPLTIDLAQGARHSRQLVDADGLAKRAETALAGNTKLVSECETQRGAL